MPLAALLDLDGTLVDANYYLDRLLLRDVVDGWTTSDDVESTKPEPDLVRAALEKAGQDEAVFVGDTGWDVEAAASAGLETICVITGGWPEQELREAGAVAVYESLEELTERLDETPFAG